ncbi:type I-E CRISPR-associated protein Cas6/Cse3/CasE [Pannonibacter sp. Pt2-lr]
MSGLYLSRLDLRRSSRNVAPLIGLLNPVDSAAQMNNGHRLLWTAMPAHMQGRAAESRAGEGVPFLWRRDTHDGRYYVLGPELGQEESPFFEISSRPFEPHLDPGDLLAFELSVNATVDRKIGTDGSGRPLRKRSDVVMDLIHRREAEAGGAVQRGSLREAAAHDAAVAWLKGQGNAPALLSRACGWRLTVSSRCRAARASPPASACLTLPG